MSEQNDSLASMEARFPYQFEGYNLGISVPKGWMPVFSELCADIDQALGTDKRGFCWRQVKEKFGTGRFYWALDEQSSATRIDVALPNGSQSFQSSPSAETSNNPVASIAEAIHKLVHEAEAKTSEICILCGEEPAKPDSTTGYVLTLCKLHTELRMRDPDSLPSPWDVE